jgi:hypothetical protein
MLELADEFLRRETPRAKEEVSNWPESIIEFNGPGFKYVGSPKQMEDLAIRLVQLSIQLHEVGKGLPSDVAGPIDAARLTSGGVSWIQRKHNCPENKPSSIL